MKAWRFWVTLFSERETGTTLAWLRIATALVILYSLLSIAAADLVEVLWVHVDHGGEMLRIYTPSALISWLGGPTSTTIWTLWWTSLAAALLLLVGLGSRLTPLVLAQCYMALHGTNVYAFGAYEFLITNALWLLVLGNATATLSVDCKLSTGAAVSDRLVAAWPRYLFIFQILVVYFATGVQKTSSLWTPLDGYSALHYVLHDPTWLRWDVSELADSLVLLTRLGTAITWHWEHLGPIVVLAFFYYRYTGERKGRLRRWFTRWDLRIPFLAIGVLLHINILLLLNVGPFSWISMAYYLALLKPEELEALGGRVKRLFARSS